MEAILKIPRGFDQSEAGRRSLTGARLFPERLLHFPDRRSRRRQLFGFIRTTRRNEWQAPRKTGNIGHKLHRSK
jgi:hypothetical protein